MPKIAVKHIGLISKAIVQSSVLSPESFVFSLQAAVGSIEPAMLAKSRTRSAGASDLQNILKNADSERMNPFGEG